MNRQAGAIPPIRSERYPKRLIVFDTEAYRSPPVNGVELQSLRLGVALYLELDKDQGEVKREYYNFTTTEGLVDFIEWHTRKDNSLMVYAHNLRYDLQLSGLYTGLVDSGWSTSLFVIESPPTFIKLKRGRMSITLVDTFNYWQYSLKEMGEQLGLPKFEVDFNAVTDSELLIYCKRDVEVLTAYLLKFIVFLSDNELSGLGLTLASQAFRTYRARFMQAEIILHNRPEVLTLERDAYFGGRCEAYFIGNPDNPPYYKLDVNSMYPFVMSSNSYPVELVGYSENVPLKFLERRLNGYYCVGDCLLNTDIPAYAYNRGDKLLFPVGEFRAILHHTDLLRARERGEIKAVYRLAIYYEGEVFTRYVDYFYSLKLKAEHEGDKITRQQAKIFLNSLYGKFGQRQVVSKIVDNSGEYKFARVSGYSESLHQTVEVNYLGNKMELRYKSGESYYSSPVIAGAVTAYARAYLWRLMSYAGLKNVYYVDTDSLIVNLRGYHNLRDKVSSNELGALKLEGESDNLYIQSVKDYRFGGEVKVKGVPKSARKLSDNQWEYEQFRGAKTWLADGMDKGVKVYTRIKERKSIYDKGFILPNGVVLPLYFGGVE